MMIQAAIIMLGVSFYREKRQKTAQERSQQRKGSMLVGQHLPRTLVLVALIALLRPGVASAHGGGTPQLTNVAVGPYHLFAWTSPEPWRVGSAHTTVALTRPLDDGQETPVSGAQVTVVYAPVGQPDQVIRVLAVEQSGAQAGFYEADATLGAAGDWQIGVEVAGVEDNSSAAFQVQVLPANNVNWWLIGGGVLLALAAVGFGVSRKGKARRTDAQRASGVARSST